MLLPNSPEGVSGARLGVSKQLLELGEDLLDRVQVGAVTRQEQQAGAARVDRVTHARDLVARQVVGDHHIVRLERWRENLFDIGQERAAVDRAIQRSSSDLARLRRTSLVEEWVRKMVRAERWWALEEVRGFIGGLYGPDLHAKRVDALAGATLGVMAGACWRWR